MLQYYSMQYTVIHKIHTYTKMNLSTVKWAQWDKTQSRELICVCIALCTIAAHNRHDNFPSYPPDNHHCSDDVYLREQMETNEFYNAFATRMWANAKRDGRPAKYRWRPWLTTAKFGWRPLMEYRPVTLPRRKSRWNLLGCPKLTKRSQPLVGRSPRCCRDMWGRYCYLASFFYNCWYMPLVAKI